MSLARTRIRRNRRAFILSQRTTAVPADSLAEIKPTTDIVGSGVEFTDISDQPNLINKSSDQGETNLDNIDEISDEDQFVDDDQQVDACMPIEYRRLVHFRSAETKKNKLAGALLDRR